MTLEAIQRTAGPLCQEVVAVEASGDAEQRLAAKDSFYDALMAGTGNAEIVSLLREINARTLLLRALSPSGPGPNTYLPS